MTNEEITTITKKLAETLLPKKIYLFGSYARGDNRADSDYDFYVVMPDGEENVITLEQKAYRALRGMYKKYRRSIDVLVGYETHFAERAKYLSLERDVKKEGILVYGE